MEKNIDKLIEDWKFLKEKEIVGRKALSREYGEIVDMVEMKDDLVLALNMIFSYGDTYLKMLDVANMGKEVRISGSWMCIQLNNGWELRINKDCNSLKYEFLQVIISKFGGADLTPLLQCILYIDDNVVSPNNLFVKGVCAGNVERWKVTSINENALKQNFWDSETVKDFLKDFECIDFKDCLTRGVEKFIDDQKSFFDRGYEAKI